MLGHSSASNEDSSYGRAPHHEHFEPRIHVGYQESHAAG
jgi:hypothetical protein